MSTPQFTIIITSYNQHEFIRDAVESALQQRCLDKEIIVVDDGSSDGSAEILDRYGPVFQLVKFSQNRGAIAARNEGAARARGRYLVFLDGDDLLGPWALELYARLIAERTPKVILAKRRWFVGAVLPVADAEAPRAVTFTDYAAVVDKDRSWDLCASTLVLDRQTFQQVGGWTPGIFHLDLVDLVTKLYQSGPVLVVSSPSSVFYRSHDGNSILTVPPFLRMAQHILRKEKEGGYGIEEANWKRYAWFGGMVFYWTKRGLHQGLYKDASLLALRGFAMIAAAILCRANVWLHGQRQTQSLALRPGSEERAEVMHWNLPSKAVTRFEENIRKLAITVQVQLMLCSRSKLARVVIVLALALSVMWLLKRTGKYWDIMLHGYDIHTH